jgi:hypothetical protein
MLGGFVVTTVWRVFKLRMEGRPTAMEESGGIWRNLHQIALNYIEFNVLNGG